MQNYEQKHLSKVRETLGECVVLLKKDGNFPLSNPCDIDVFGNGVRNTLKGGTGSSDVHSHYVINIEHALQDAGFNIKTIDWLNAYDKMIEKEKYVYVKKIKHESREHKANIIFYSMGKEMNEPEYSIPFKKSSDVCIYVLSRRSGEGDDRTFDKGQIRLTDTEINTILKLNKSYDKFMLVLNTCGVVDLTEVKDVKNILLLSQLGSQTGYALTDILLGKQNPSGKLTCSWASSNSYFENLDFNDINQTIYRDGIYVGYRYFDSFHKEVLFPFGYGLSYSEFTTNVKNITLNHDLVQITTEVKNVGKYAGKEVVQIYLSKPSVSLDEPYQELCAFAKTESLNSNTTQVLSLKFNLSDFGSFEESSGNEILEKGNYIIRVGNSSRNTKPVACIELEETVILNHYDYIFPNVHVDEIHSQKHEEDICNLKHFVLSSSSFMPKFVSYESKDEILDEVKEFTDNELILASIGSFSSNLETSVIGDGSQKVCGASGQTSHVLDKYGSLVMADGPGGLRLIKDYFKDEHGFHIVNNSVITEDRAPYMSITFLIKSKLNELKNKPKKDTVIEHQYCTSIPVATAIAQSFNLNLAESYADIVGSEMERFGVQLWLAPGLNIIRSIQCGRNFEYYSEDPFLSGKFAASITKGVQKHTGHGVVIKHFLANNKEKNRYCNNSILSERTLRDIYLRGFKICVQEARPHGLMTSYNLINGIHTAEHINLLNKVLRNELGYEGIVLTDWMVDEIADKDSLNRVEEAKYVMKAHGGIFMPGSQSDFNNIKEGLREGTVTRNDLEINVSRIIKLQKYLSNKE